MSAMTLEDLLRQWSEPPSVTEQQKCDHAEMAVRKAIAGSSQLVERNIQVFAQGSYRNRTNVKKESDVDVCVCFTDSFFPTYPEGTGNDDFGNVDSDYKYAKFKDEVEAALRSYFGSASVHRGNKAFDVRENSYRVDADVVATFEHRRYTGKAQEYHAGTKLLPDNGGSIINWPQQNYDNGVAKNAQTGERFKRQVRVLKNLRNDMEDQKVLEASPIPSYLIECLIWNVPNDRFNQTTYVETLKASLAYLITNTDTDEKCREWGEENELKYLFRPSQGWSRAEVNAFLLRAWRHIGF